jgi:hypothetical protein
MTTALKFKVGLVIAAGTTITTVAVLYLVRNQPTTMDM